MYTLHTYSTEITPANNQYLYTQTPRNQSAGYKVLLDIPDYLSTPADLSSEQALAYNTGVKALLHKYVQNYIKNNKPSYDTKLPAPTFADLSITTTQLTKQAIQDLFNAELSALITMRCVENNLDDNQTKLTLNAYETYYTKLASPSTTYQPEIAQKLLTYLKAVEFDTPTSLSLIKRLEKQLSNKQYLTNLI